MAAVPASPTQASPSWLTADAATRDRAGQPPTAELALLKDSGLITLPGPRDAGGGGAGWATAYAVVNDQIPEPGWYS
jgi:hypothetical protein